MASSLGKAYVEVEANADKVGPEIEARFVRALDSIVSSAETVFGDVGDESEDAARLIAEAFEERGADAGRSIEKVGSSMAAAGDKIGTEARAAADDMARSLGEGGKKGGEEAAAGFDRAGFAKKVAVAGAAAGAALGLAVAGAMNVEQANDKLAAQLGLNGPRAAELGAVAGRLYAGAYGENLEEVNVAVGAVVSSIGGMRTASGADIQALTTQALNFATAFDQDVAESASTAGILLKNGLAKDGTEAFDLLTRSFQTVPAAMREELPAILNEYGTNFRALGFTGEQAFGLLSGAAAGGAIVLDKVGDSLKEFTIRGSDMSATSVAAYESIGLNAQKMSDLIAAGGPGAQRALQQTAKAIGDIQDPATRANTAIALFGTPLEDLSIDQIPAFLSSISDVGGGMTDAAGAVDRLGETLNDNASSNLESFKRQATQTFVNVLGGTVLPIVNSIASTLATQFGPAVEAVGGFITGTLLPALQSMAGWVEDNQTAILIIASIIAAIFLPHLIALAVQATITKVQVVATWIAQQAATVAAAVVHSAQIAWMILRWIAMAAAAVLNAGLTVGAWIGMGIAAGIQAGIVAAAWLGAQIRTIASLVAMGASFVVQGAVMVASTAVTVASVVAGWVLMGAQAMLAAIRMAAAWFIALGPVGWVIAAVIGLVALIIANWDTVKRFTVEAFNAVVGAVVGAFHWVVDAVSSGISNVVSFFTGLPGQILRTLGNLGSLLLGAGRDLIGGFVNGIANAAGFVGDIGRNVVNSIVRFINSNVIDRINNLLEFKVGPLTINPPDIPRIPQLAEGAVVNRPTLAVVGEDGPEVVLPLSARRAGRRAALMDEAGLTGAGTGPGTTIDARQFYEVKDTQTAEEVGAVVGQRIVRDIRNGVASRYATGNAA